MSDEMKATIFTLIWEVFLFTGTIVYMVTGEGWGYHLFLTDTAIQLLIVYYDYRLERAEKRIKKTQQHLSQMSADYSEFVRDHNDYTTLEVTSYEDGKRTKYQRRIS